MLAIAILAAGKGTRMKSNIPKVLQKVGGCTLVERVLSSCEQINPDRKVIIIGHKGEQIKHSLIHHKELEFVIQQPQNGTGHAVQQLVPILKDFEGDLLVLNGDVPLLKTYTIQQLLAKHLESHAEVTCLSARLSEPDGYGRVFSDDQGNIDAIIEEKDCTSEQRKNTLTNSGVYCFNWKKLTQVLSDLSNQNEQKEIYLTDAVTKLSIAKHLEIDDPREVSGINNKIQMAQCEAFLQEDLRNFWMNKGVTFIDPASCTISDNCCFGNDVVIEPQTHLRGHCHIGDNCHLGPGSFISNSSIGNNVNVIYSVMNNSVVENDIFIGPYAHLRPDSKINNNCKIGNFVEIKKSNIGQNTNISHLSYIGDSDLGSQVNIGAGTITANYDGREKHKTIIGDHTKTGANSVLIAPIKLGDNVTVGAGSTITEDVPHQALTIARNTQVIKENWSQC